MKVKSLAIYSYDGRIREVSFNTGGLSIITGSSSTGKSAIVPIIDYCMGRSEFTIPDGEVRDKVSWYAVIFEFDGEEILVAKPSPDPAAKSSSRAMVSRGAEISFPDFEHLAQNCDDATVTSILTNALGIPDNATYVADHQSRASIVANVRHTSFYLFQPFELIAHPRHLFYRQDEDHMLLTIKDTFLVLFGIYPHDRVARERQIRRFRRELRIAENRYHLAEKSSLGFVETTAPLLVEAVAAGLIAEDAIPEDEAEVIAVLRSLLEWIPEELPERSGSRASEVERSLRATRAELHSVQDSISAARLYAMRVGGFESEALEQRERLQSIDAFPRSRDNGEWLWPFAEEKLGLSSTIADALLGDLASLDAEIEYVITQRPRIQAYIAEMGRVEESLAQQVARLEGEYSAILETDLQLRRLAFRNVSAARVVGRISRFLEELLPVDELKQLESDIARIRSRIRILESDIDDARDQDRLSSALNVIGSWISEYNRVLGAEFSEYPARLDFGRLTLVVDRPIRSTPMGNTGSSQNHLIHHIATLLAIHRFALDRSLPIPQFLVLDQPTQPYFPSLKFYEDLDGSPLDVEPIDADLAAVIRLFDMLRSFVDNDCPGFQIIVTEHANLPIPWFQDALVEPPWLNPPALVPEDWPSLESI